MKKPIAIVCVLLISFITACKKTGGSATTSTGTSHARNAESDRAAASMAEISRRLGSAKELFKKHDVKAALLELEAAYVIDPKNPEVLNVRGSCHVEMRDFEKAIDDFTAASKESPQSPAIFFNLGEVQFVTKNWKNSITAFEESKSLMAREASHIRDLIDFKILLCHAGLRNDQEFDRLAKANPGTGATLKDFFTEAAVAYHSNNEKRAEEVLFEAERAFPNRQDRAPWEDTMIEFGFSR